MSRPPDSPSWREFVGLDDEALLRECEVDRFRASGPGGQKRNKTDSAVRLRHRPTGLAGEASESRSQHENRARALRRLRRTLALNARASVTLEDYVPSSTLRGALDAPPSARNPVFLEAVAELFDVLDACEWRMTEAARHLECSLGALTRLLATDDLVWRAAAEARVARGLQPLRRRD